MKDYIVNIHILKGGKFNRKNTILKLDTLEESIVKAKIIETIKVEDKWELTKDELEILPKDRVIIYYLTYTEKLSE